jgi:hypothetical protein
MAPVGPLKFKRMPESVRRRLDVAAAAAWQGIVDAHAHHAARFVRLLANRVPTDQALERYLSEMDVRDPMASAIRTRVMADPQASPPPATPDAAESETPDGLKRFRPDVLVKGIARRVRENELVEEWILLAIARAEEGVIREHIDNAIAFTRLLDGHVALDEGVEDYIDLMRITGGRAQAVYQRTMAVLADLHLPGEPAQPADPPQPADSPDS